MSPRFVVKKSARSAAEALERTANVVAFRKRVDALLGLGVKVGFPEGEKHEPDGTPLALIAAANNFGTDTIPERPFISPAIKGAKPKFRRLNQVNLARVLEGNLLPEQAAGQLGVMAKGEVQRYIRHGEFAPNAPSTIAAKGSSAPLIDKAQLVQGVQYEVTTNGGTE